MQKQVIKFTNRSPYPNSIFIGNEDDNLARRVQFVLPSEIDGAKIYLHLSIGEYSDVIELDDSLIYVPTRTHTQYPGNWTGYLEAHADNDIVWHSNTFTFKVGDLPDSGEQIEQAYPTAIEEALRVVDTLTGVGARAVTLEPGSDATVSFEEDPSGKRTIIYGIPRGADGSGGGSDGATFTPSVSDEGVISWTNDKDLPNPDPVNIKGKTGPAGTDGKSAYAYAVDGGYTGTEVEFAAKLAEEMPTVLPNPSALTFSGAVSGSYDGSAKMSARIPQVVSWANKELLNKADLVDPGNLNSFVIVDGVEYYRYHAGGTYGFIWNNPHPLPGSVTITARGVLQYGGSGDTRLKTIYDDGTYGPDLYIVVSGESKTATVTTDASKTLAKITGNYDLENWVLLDMSVMSIVANYNVGVPLANSNVPGGIKADPATSADTVPAKIGEDGKLYVPDMSGGSGGTASGDYIPVPSTAEVGQTIVVKAVDESGKPTEWEAVDVASGEGDNWKLLVDFESTEEITANTGMVFDTADDGTPIDAKEIIIDWYCPAATQPAYATFKVNDVGCNGYALSHYNFFWSGILIGGSASSATLHFKPLTDVCLLTGDKLNNSPEPIWFAKSGAFKAITSLQLTMFGGTYPVGLKIKIFGR